MALTQQEILETRKRLGIPEGGVSAPAVNSAAQNVARRRQLAAEYDAKQAEQKPGFLSRVGEDLKKRAESIKETISEGMKGESNPLRSGVRIAGQIAGGIGDVVAEGAVSGFRALPDSVEQPIRNAGTKILQTKVGQAGLEAIEQGVEAYEAFKTKYPEIAEDLEAVVNIASILPAWKGAQVGTKAAQNVVRVGGEIVDTVGDVTKKVTKTVGDIKPQAAKVAKDIIPTRKEVISGQITKALDLTQGDVSNIKLSTKNDVGDWISNKNLIGGNKKETLGKIKELTDTQYKAVREEISKVPTTYKPVSIPRVRESLGMLESDLKEVLGQEKAYQEVTDLLKKKTYKLEDVQRVKELLDDQFDLYKATGDVKAGQTKAGLANVRQELKNFIEKEVKDNTGADIRGMNNDVSTGKSIQQLAEKRSTRDFTRANVSLSDLTAFGTGSILGTPLVGAAAFVVKRIVETPTMRLKFAQFLKSLPKKEVEVIKKTLLKGEVPEQLNAFEKANNFLKDRAGLVMKEIKEIDSLTKDEMIDAIDYIRLKKPYDQAMEESIGKLTEKFGIQYKDLNKISDAFENLVETTKTKYVGGKVVKK